jgi:hypothetical protein
VLPRSLSIAEIRGFKPESVAEVDNLLNHHRDQEIANIPNNRGLRTGEGKPFKRTTICFLR